MPRKKHRRKRELTSASTASETRFPEGRESLAGPEVPLNISVSITRFPSESLIVSTDYYGEGGRVLATTDHRLGFQIPSRKGKSRTLNPVMLKICQSVRPLSPLPRGE